MPYLKVSCANAQHQQGDRHLLGQYDNYLIPRETPFEDLVSGMGIEFNYTTEDKIPGWYQFYTCADKNMRIPGWKPEYNVQQGTFLYRNNLKFAASKSYSPTISSS